MSQDESLPMGQLTEEQQQRAAEAQEIAEIKRRHEAAEGQAMSRSEAEADGDRARLLAIAEAALLREARLAGELREAREGLALYRTAWRSRVWTLEGREIEVCFHAEPYDAVDKWEQERPARTLASLDDACDGGDR